ncbi:MAG: hypothetical protein KDD94_02030, partial [Calditrichaeota bacterium]|nr:hypothetical protein [Calditrichota bacterium]
VTLTGKSTVTDIKVFDQEFRPVSRAILSEELLKRIETVKTDHVTGFTYFPTDSVAKLSFNIEKESFHAGMPELLLSTMLKKSSDQSVRIRNFSSDLLSYPAWLNGFTVVKRMNDLSLKIGSKTFSTTRFICSFQDSKGAQMPLPEIQYWISAEKPYLIQMMVAGMVYELAELDFQKLE